MPVGFQADCRSEHSNPQILTNYISYTMDGILLYLEYRVVGIKTMPSSTFDFFDNST